MCGISGIMNFNGKPVENSLILKMNNKIAHRGHDNSKVINGSVDYSFSKYKGIALGHRRLSIIDLSENGNQPMFSNSKNLCIVYNGEIYNANELRSKYSNQGYKFKSKCDTEVILAGYEIHGEKILNELNGMFSFAIWNEIEKSLFCARDPFGIKPFYYFLDNESFLFSSESKAINSIINQNINQYAYSSYLFMNYVPGEMSIFKSIKKLHKGTYLKLYCDGRTIGRKYWNFEEKICNTNLSFNDSAKLIEEKLNQSVKLQLTSDVPVGVFLSGGFDSGLLTAISKNYIDDLHTYTVGFDDKIQVSEINIAKKLAKKYSTNHHEKIIESKNIINLLDKAISCLNEPVSDSAIVPSFFLSKCASDDGVKVILSGTGGDEIFGGYERYYGYSYKRYFFDLISNDLKNTLSKFPGLEFFTSKRLKHNSLDMIMSTGGSPNLLNSIFSSTKELNNFIEDYFINYIPRFSNSLSNLKSKMKFDIDLYLPDLLLMFLDQVTMSNTIEGRVPYLDKELVSFSFGLNSDYHLNKNSNRRIQKKISENKLISETFNQKKQGFSGPVIDWINNNFGHFFAVIMESDVHNINRKFLEKLYLKQKLNNRDYYVIFSIYCYTTWFKNL